MVLGVVVWKCSCDVFPFYSFKRASRSHAKTGLFSVFFRCVFLGRFWKGLFLVFLWFREVLRVPREVIFGTFLNTN